MRLTDNLGKLSRILETDHFALVVHEQMQCKSSHLFPVMFPLSQEVEKRTSCSVGQVTLRLSTNRNTERPGSEGVGNVSPGLCPGNSRPGLFFIFAPVFFLKGRLQPSI